jgi:hypothetical protein
MNVSFRTILHSLNTFAKHLMIPIGSAFIVAIAVLISLPVHASQVAVRFPEGVTHGFLLVRSLAGEIIGDGEITQIVKKDDLVENQLVFRFKDGSLHDEKVAFSQQRVFTLISYSLIQRGPSFPDQTHVSIDRGTGEYKVRQAREDGKEQVLTGKFDLPKDAYNGMLIMLLTNLPTGSDETVSLLVFSPEPQAIKLQLLAKGEQTVHLGEASSKAIHYVFNPEIGVIRKLVGKAIGKLPAHFHYDCWILADEVPSFVKFEGPLQLMGPIMQIELVSPRLLSKPEVEQHSPK